LIVEVVSAAGQLGGGALHARRAQTAIRRLVDADVEPVVALALHAPVAG